MKSFESPLRQTCLRALKERIFDVVVIGGGATGSAIALEATRGGLSVGLIERFDFSAGTSSKSTKLLHGGVRYLEKAFKSADLSQFRLVRDALLERKTLIKMAPHLAGTLDIVIPLYHCWELPYYFAGLKTYDLLAGGQGLGSSRMLSVKQTLDLLPNLDASGLKGSVVYTDGQFDDARMNIELAMTAVDEGASIANYVNLIAINKLDGKIESLTVEDSLAKTGSLDRTFTVRGKSFINATGPYTDQIRQMDDPTCNPMVRVSSGSHIVVDKRFLPGVTGILVPKTPDKRVVFILPWKEHVLIGTTDEESTLADRPTATERDIEYICEIANRYLKNKISRGDVLASWSGFRPLVAEDGAASTAQLSRDHTIITAPSGLVSITGGKWTTVRNMAHDALKTLVGLQYLPPLSKRIRSDAPLRGGKKDGASPTKANVSTMLPYEVVQHIRKNYGYRYGEVIAFCEGERGTPILAGLPFTLGEIQYCIEREMATSAEDFFERRVRLGFLNSENYALAVEAIRADSPPAH